MSTKTHHLTRAEHVASFTDPPRGLPVKSYHLMTDMPEPQKSALLRRIDALQQAMKAEGECDVWDSEGAQYPHTWHALKELREVAEEAEAVLGWNPTLAQIITDAEQGPYYAVYIPGHPKTLYIFVDSNEDHYTDILDYLDDWEEDDA